MFDIVSCFLEWVLLFYQITKVWQIDKWKFTTINQCCISCCILLACVFCSVFFLSFSIFCEFHLQTFRRCVVFISHQPNKRGKNFEKFVHWEEVLVYVLLNYIFCVKILIVKRLEKYIHF